MNIFGVSRKRKLDQLEQDVSTLQTFQTAAQTDISNLQNSLANGETKLDQLEQDVSTLQTFQTAAQTDISVLQNDLANDETKLDQLEQDVSTLQENSATYVTQSERNWLRTGGTVALGSNDLGSAVQIRQGGRTVFNLQGAGLDKVTSLWRIQDKNTDEFYLTESDLAQLEQDVSTLQTFQTEAQTDISTVQNDLDEVKTNPIDLQDNIQGYYPEWFHTSPSNILTSSNGILEKINSSQNVDFAFTKPSINPQQFNYIVTFSVLASNSGAQLYAGFGTLGTTPFHRAGSSYPTTSGTTGSWPSSGAVNGWGSAWQTRLTPAFGAVDKNFPVTGTTYVSSGDEVDVTSATSLNPYSLTVHIVDGYVTKMLVSYSTGGIVTEIDYMVTQNWPPWELPKGNLYIQYLDTNNYPSGNSDWTVRTNIMQRTKRTDTYTLVTGLQGNPSLYPEVVTQSGVEGRFIPVGCKVAKLQGHPGATNTIHADIYFLPPATRKGERIVLINESGRNLTIYQPQPTDPTDPSATTSPWANFTFNHSATQDHTEFVALSTFEWHRLI